MKRLLFILLLSPVFVEGQIITTFAGNGTYGYSGNGGPATTANITRTVGGVFDVYGNYYFACNNAVRKVTPCGTITTVAGNGVSGFSGDGGSATMAQISYQPSVGIDRIGNLYIADEPNYRIRKVDTAGIITTIAGNGTLAFSGDGGPATAASLWAPSWVYVDDTGNIYDVETCRIRKIDTSGIIHTIIGNGTGSYGGDGGLASLAEIQPLGAYLDAHNNLYIADAGNYRVRKVDAVMGIITTVAGDGTPGYCCDGVAATSASMNPFAVTVDMAGNLFIAEADHNRILKVNTGNIISTFAGTGTTGYSGDGGPATAAEIHAPEGLVFDVFGNLYIADDNNCRIRKVTINPSEPCLEQINNTVIVQIISIFPNPATTSLTITSPQNITNITITKLIGQTVYTHVCNSPQVEVNVADLPPGIYFVKVNNTEVRKFVKE